MGRYASTGGALLRVHGRQAVQPFHRTGVDSQVLLIAVGRGTGFCKSNQSEVILCT